MKRSTIHGRRWVAAIGLAFAVVAAATACAGAEGEPASGPDIPEVKSMGFPRHWRPSVGAMLDWDRDGAGSRLGGEVHASLYKDLINPATNILGVTGEGYGLWVNDDADGGARLLLSSPAAMFHFGLDYAFGADQVDFVFSLTPAFRRSGLFGLGDNLRIDWYPARGNSFMFGFGIPLEPRMGKTRPRDKKVTLPKAEGGSTRSEEQPSPELKSSLERLEHAATWIQLYTAPFIDNEISTEPAKMEVMRKALNEARGHFNQMGDQYPSGHTAAAEVAVYHQELERAFELAGAGSEAPAVAAQARVCILDAILLPYNRLLGQRKERDSLLGYAEAAEREFATWLATTSIPADRQPALAQVFHRVVETLEHCRAQTRDRWTDSRLVWMALELALRPEDHDTQAELDALLAKTVEDPFTDGNDIFYMRSDLFQQELARSVMGARDYHVLWIHDYRGLNAIKQPDEIGFRQTVQIYLAALTEQVRNFDRTGHLASYFVFIDQMYYEANQGRLWLELMADPLHHEVDLPPGYESWEAEIHEAQELLRAAVAGSTGLTAGSEQHGEKWLRERIGVHVNVTNPADVSFRNDDFAKHVNFAPDLVMRDHRKIAFWDVNELDPGRGGAIFTGTGVGEHYVGPTWDDRALRVHGPALLGLKREARELLRSQGFKPDDIPVPFRALDLPADYDSKIAALQARGWQTRALEVQNGRGFGPKPATVIKAAQYNLMPAGSFLFVPDSLWNSTLWGSMLFGAALRGCQVAIVCPSQANAPSDGLPQMSRTTELFTRLVVLANEFDHELASAGGSFHTGIYDHDVAGGDYARSLRVLSERLRDQPFLHQAFPFKDEVLASVAALADTLDARGYSAQYLVDDAVARRPKLHLKVQFMATADVIPTLASRPEWSKFIQDLILSSTKQLEGESAIDTKALRAAVSAPADSLVGNWWQSLSASDREHLALYMTVGSHNQNYRSMIMDGEDIFVVSGLSSLVAYLDFARVLGLSTWVTDVPTLEKLLPKPTGIGRWMRNAI
jgi:phosphatidylserine/phosphatidylglycerophosphate/cardiolipin synthase-like enzyme